MIQLKDNTVIFSRNLAVAVVIIILLLGIVIGLVMPASQSTVREYSQANDQCVQALNATYNGYNECAELLADSRKVMQGLLKANQDEVCIVPKK